MTEALATFHKEVKERKFPSKEHSYPINEEEIKKLLNYLEK